MDDITIIRRVGESEVVEFVQVKATDAEQLWSIAQLCSRDGQVIGTSILEKSLANDRCEEACSFHMVTTLGLRNELEPLSYPVDEAPRLAAIPAVKSKLVGRLPEYLSPNGHNAGWWAERARWSVMHGSNAVSDFNRHLLTKIIESTEFSLFSDQIEKVYELLLQRIAKASAADKQVTRDAGKIRQGELRSWLEDRIRECYDSAHNSGSGLLKTKLNAAGLDDDAIAAASELRRLYRAKTLDVSYLDLDDMRSWENGVRGVLNRLRASLDTGALSDSGVQFHARALGELQRLARDPSRGQPAPPDEFLQGCMYHITSLCQHRFVRAEI